MATELQAALAGDYFLEAGGKREPVSLRPDGTVADAPKESWEAQEQHGRKVITLKAGDTPYAILSEIDGQFRGRMLHGDRDACVLVPKGTAPVIRRAFLLLGPEASGVHDVRHHLVKRGVQGSTGAGQMFDGPRFTIKVPADAKDVIAVSRSFPHAGHWVDIEAAVKALRDAGYQPHVIVVVRHSPTLVGLMVKEGHAGHRRQAASNLDKAHQLIFDTLLQMGQEFSIYTYEGFCQTPPEEMARRLGL